MPFQKIQPEKLSHSVVRQIELLILRGILRPGERLPSERDLASRLAVSRPSLREAIANLSERGLLTSRAGAGIFVSDLIGSAFSPALIDLFASHEQAVFDYISFRRDLEGLAAERAATHGTAGDLELIATLLSKMEATHQHPDPEEEARLDAAFHLAIIEASHNIVMLHMMRSMFDLLRQGVFYNRQLMFHHRSIRGQLLDQHREICRALQARDGPAARAAIETHLGFVETALGEQVQGARHEEIARQRLEHERHR